MLIRTFEHERAGIGEHGGIKTSRDFRRNLDARLPRQAVHQLRGGYGLGINPVHIGKCAAALVMVNVNQEPAFEAFEAGALNAVTFEQDGGIIISVHTFGLDHARGKRQLLIDARHSVAQYDFRLLAHLAQDFSTSERRSNRVAVGTSVRGQHKRLALFDLVEQFVQHGCSDRVGTDALVRPSSHGSIALGRDRNSCRKPGLPPGR